MSPNIGGCDFLADPRKRADESTVFWHPDALATVVILTVAPAATETMSVSPSDWPGDIARRDADDGSHLMIRDHATSHQVWMMHPLSGAMAVAAVIPLDASASQRMDATLRFWRFAAHGRSRTSPSRVRRVDRLVAAMRALDARMAGASYRAIAEVLFDPHRVASEPWKTASLRDTVIRLARTGFAMMRGDYRNLLGPNRRD